MAETPSPTASLEEYGRLFRAAYYLLHATGQEPLGKEVAGCSHIEAARAVLEGLRTVAPPVGLEEAHTLIITLLEVAMQVWEALEAQLQEYLGNDFAQSQRHAEEVARLVAAAAQVDRRLMLCLASLERARPGTLQVLGLSLPGEADIPQEDDLP